MMSYIGAVTIEAQCRVRVRSYGSNENREQSELVAEIPV